MVNWRRVFGLLTLAGVAAGFAVGGNGMLLYLALPLGCSCFGMYLIFRMLEGESASYDTEHLHPAHARPEAQADADKAGSTAVETAHGRMVAPGR
jgi:hypothetical protein